MPYTLFYRCCSVEHSTSQVQGGRYKCAWTLSPSTKFRSLSNRKNAQHDSTPPAPRTTLDNYLKRVHSAVVLETESLTMLNAHSPSFGGTHDYFMSALLQVSDGHTLAPRRGYKPSPPLRRPCPLHAVPRRRKSPLRRSPQKLLKLLMSSFPGHLCRGSTDEVYLLGVLNM